ncbi:MAG: anthranilate phosphoribosyltransferase [Arenicellales bacterium]|jgi:anthranilate phosphoribosyltransferase|nr:anthranilate phosphoribosyltransferase [Arenicellales bacterium]MDP7284440.1 anthranilate phosphoribosyltransferase [Arenicellales bacterium]
MDIQSAIKWVTERQDLTAEEMRGVMQVIMSGDATPAQIGGFLIGLRMKGETIDEIAAAAGVMRDLATRVEVDLPHLVDTAGTGGDGSNTFNISTAAAIVAAAAGAKVAKHGNRSISSRSGSADLLEAAGARIDLDAEQVAHCIRDVGVGFMFAPQHHGAMRFAIGPRRELGMRTLFNVLGPLTNPAGAPNQLMGVFSADLVEPMAQVLGKLGSNHVLVVHAEDGMDEISICGPTHVAELKEGEVTTYTITPEQFGFSPASMDSLVADSAEGSLGIVHGLFTNDQGPARDIVALNAGAAIYVAGLADTLGAGVAKASEVIASGDAAVKLEQFVASTQQAG